MIQRALLAAVAAGTLASASPEVLTYRFDEVKSKVLAAPAGDESRERRVAVGDSAAGGDVVRTGFWARTVVSVPARRARFEISSSSRVKLQGDEPGVLLALEKGRLKAFFDALTEGPPVERRVAAPGALLAVRGTRYGLEVGGDGTSLLAVFEGTVEVIPSAPGATMVQVHADEFCTFGPRAAPVPMPMRSYGMSEGSWGRHQAPGGGVGPDGRPRPDGGPGMPGGGSQPRGGPPPGGSPMGPRGH